MELTDHKAKLKEINRKCAEDTHAAQREFAMEHNTAAVGDIIHGCYGVTIKIANIGVHVPFNSRVPQCVYKGPKCTVDGQLVDPEVIGSVRQGQLTTAEQARSINKILNLGEM